MRRAGLSLLGLSVVLAALSLAGRGLGEGGVVTGIFGTALGGVLALAAGSTGGSSGDSFDGGDGA